MRLIIFLLILFPVTSILSQNSWWDKTKQKAREYYDNTKKNYEHWKQENPGVYQKMGQKTKEITSEISKNPGKIFEYKKQADKYVQKAVIRGVKNIPVYDSRTGQTTTFDTYCRQFVKEVGGDAVSGSEIEQDPVGTAMMIMMDEDYMLEAKLIKSPNGDWISMNEASYGFIDPNMLGLLQGDYSAMKQAYNSGSTNDFTTAFDSFEKNLSIVNQFNSSYTSTTNYSNSAAYNVNVTTPRECWSALISEREASTGQYGWWSIWHDKKRSGNINKTPTTYYNLSPGKYVLVVYDPNRGNESRSDGVVIEDIYIDGQTLHNFNLQQSDFKDWNCLSCPWLYVYNGKDYIKMTEVLKDVVGKNSCKTDYTEIPGSFIIDNKLKIFLQEEKEETTYIDGVSIMINDKEVFPALLTADQISYNDDNFLVLKKGERVNISFDLSDSMPIEGTIRVKVRGYYVPEESFVQKYLEALK